MIFFPGGAYNGMVSHLHPMGLVLAASPRSFRGESGTPSGSGRARPARASRRPTAGFTVLEVVVAMAIFALVAVPLLELQLSAASQTARVNLQRRAHYAGVAYMDDLLAAVPVFRGERVEKQGDFEFRARTEQFMEQYGMERVTVAVHSLDEGKEELDAIVSYRMR